MPLGRVTASSGALERFLAKFEPVAVAVYLESAATPPWRRRGFSQLPVLRDMPDSVRSCLMNARHLDLAVLEPRHPSLGVVRLRELPQLLVCRAIGDSSPHTILVAIDHGWTRPVAIFDDEWRADADLQRDAVRALRVIGQCRSAIAGDDNFETDAALLALTAEWHNVPSLRAAEKRLDDRDDANRTGGKVRGEERSRQASPARRVILRKYRATRSRYPTEKEEEIYERVAKEARGNLRAPSPDYPSTATVRRFVERWKEEQRRADRPALTSDAS
jgi:hypothetical protein